MNNFQFKAMHSGFCTKRWIRFIQHVRKTNTISVAKLSGDISLYQLLICHQRTLPETPRFMEMHRRTNIITTNISRLCYRFPEKYSFFRHQLSCHFYPFEHFSFVPLITCLNIKLHGTPVGDELRLITDNSAYEKCHFIIFGAKLSSCMRRSRGSSSIQR